MMPRRARAEPPRPYKWHGCLQNRIGGNGPKNCKTGKNGSRETTSPKEAKSSLGDKRSNERLIKAFESALRKKQFGEARKLLGIMERRPELRRVIKAKRNLLQKQEGAKR